ncbi:MAG TPA: ferric reductase-like transmembrane domain-containing protein [Acidimicrobiales bacterium]|nr:ferric reductase-like transmembrane domain-containing protein [Acidimicrobiales bacterium]
MMLATASSVAAVGGKAFWFLTRASGLVSIVLLSATIVLGVVASVGWTSERWPRFLSQNVHRNLSLLCIAFVGIHVVTTVLDGFVPIGFLDTVLPFHSPYRPIYLGLGALGFDLMLAVLITSGLRHRIGYGSWRFVHWLAYLCWPIALLHGLGSGTDTPLPVVLLVEAVCTAAVLGALAWRLTTGRAFPLARRAAAGIGAVVVTLAIAGFAAVGPLRPDWSHRSGTSSALLSQIAAKFGAPATTAPSSAAAAGGTPTTTAPSGSGSGSTSVPSAPFTSQITGNQTQSRPDSQGVIQITLAMRLQNSSSTPLTVVLVGQESGGGGVSLSSGTVAFGGYRGSVIGLNGGTITGQVNAPGAVTLVINLQIDQQTGALSGSVSGTPGGSLGGSGGDGR